MFKIIMFLFMYMLSILVNFILLSYIKSIRKEYGNNFDDDYDTIKMFLFVPLVNIVIFIGCAINMLYKILDFSLEDLSDKLSEWFKKRRKNK